MSEQSQPELVYKTRLVAFLDVMGFKELLRDNPGSLAQLRDFYATAADMLTFLKKDEELGRVEDNFQSIFVSDAIVASIELSENKKEALDATRAFFKKLALLQAVLALESKIWIRGAVSLGNLFIDDVRNILVGPAFVDAYNLEKTADFARVIVDPKVCRYFDLLPHTFVSSINTAGTKALMAPSNGMRWGGAIYMNDAILVDWFFCATSLRHSMEPFFKDLRDRMTSDQTLYFKSFKLLAYFRESLSDAKHKNEINQERHTEVSEMLKKFGV